MSSKERQEEIEAIARDQRALELRFLKLAGSITVSSVVNGHFNVVRSSQSEAVRFLNCIVANKVF